MMNFCISTDVMKIDGTQCAMVSVVCLLTEIHSISPTTTAGLCFQAGRHTRPDGDPLSRNQFYLGGEKKKLLFVVTQEHNQQATHCSFLGSKIKDEKKKKRVTSFEVIRTHRKAKNPQCRQNCPMDSERV